MVRQDHPGNAAKKRRRAWKAKLKNLSTKINKQTAIGIIMYLALDFLQDGMIDGSPILTVMSLGVI